MTRKTLLAAILTLMAMATRTDYQCSIVLRDDAILSPQMVQVEGRSGDLVATQAGDVTFSSKQCNPNAVQRKQAKDHQAALRSSLSWINEGTRARVEKGRVALNKIIIKETGESSNVRNRSARLDVQLREQINRIIEHRIDGPAFHYRTTDQIHADRQQLVNQAIGNVLQDGINEMGAKTVLKGGGNPLQGILGSLGGLQISVQNEWKNQEQDFQRPGKDVCSCVVTLGNDRKTLISALK